MKLPAAPPEALTHQQAQKLLPWLLAGTLDAAELAQVQSHVQACAQCQADMEWQRNLRAAWAAQPDGAFDPNRAFAKLAPRLGPQTPPVGKLDRWRTAIAANSAWLRWTAVAQFAAIGILSVLLVRSVNDAPAYRALGNAAQAQGKLVVVFKPATSESEMRRILQANGARVVDGPTVTDAYILALPATEANAALDRMRAEPAVTLAQPLAAESRP